MANPGQTLEEAVFFASAFETLFARTLRGRSSPELREKLRAAGVDLDRRLQVAYPFKVWEDVVAVLAKELHPDAGEQEAWFRLGEDFFEGYNSTMIGKAAIAMARLIGIDRLLQRFTSNMRNINNSSEALVDARERGRILLRVRTIEKFRKSIDPAPERLSEYLRGMLLGVMRGLGMANAQVKLVESHPGGHDSVYEMTWAER